MRDLTTFDQGTETLLTAIALNAAAGRQDYIRGDGTLTNLDSTARLIDAGALAPGVKKYQIAVGGAQGVDVTLGFSAVSATVPTARLYPAGADGVTQKVGSTATTPGVAFVANTPQTWSYTTLRGERFVILEITIAASNPATPSVAEYSAA